MNAILDAIFAVFTGVVDWFVETLQTVVTLFYTSETGLTFFGVLGLCALGVSLVLMFIRIVKNYLTFKG
jgi:hypothetical protein